MHLTIEGEPFTRVKIGDSKRNWRRALQARRYIGQLARKTGFRPTQSPIYVNVRFVIREHRRKDIDNMLKLLFDALNGIAWVDDNQILRVVAVKQLAFSCEMARTEVEIMEVPDAVPPSRTLRFIGWQ